MEVVFNIPPANEMYLKLKQDYDTDLANRLEEEYSVITEKASLCADEILVKIATKIQHRFIVDTKHFIVNYDTSLCMPGYYTVTGCAMNVAIASRIAEEFNKRGYVADQHGMSISITVPDPSSCVEE